MYYFIVLGFKMSRPLTRNPRFAPASDRSIKPVFGSQ